MVYGDQPIDKSMWERSCQTILELICLPVEVEAIDGPGKQPEL